VAEDKDSQIIEEITGKEYQYGFESEIKTDIFPVGLNEDIVTRISKIKNEPQFMLEWRLNAFRFWQKMQHPKWSSLNFNVPDFQSISYYAQPGKVPKYNSIDEVDPEIISTFNKLGIPLEEQKILAGVAVDAVIDSVSVHTTFRETLKEQGIIFCSISEALQEHPDLVKQYIGSVVPYTDNYYAALNSAVFSDGSFVYIPKGVRCPMELSTYFRINAKKHRSV